MLRDCHWFSSEALFFCLNHTKIDFPLLQYSGQFNFSLANKWIMSNKMKTFLKTIILVK